MTHAFQRICLETFSNQHATEREQSLAIHYLHIIKSESTKFSLLRLLH